MRATKIILIVLLILVSLVFGFTTLRAHLSGEDVGPTIACDTDLLEVSVYADDAALLAGVTAADAQDGDLTEEILIQGISKLVDENTTRITYVVFDSDGNLASTSRNLRYTDYTQPRFAITQPLQYVAGSSVGLLDRLEVTDVIDGDITHLVRVSALNATDEAEIYTVDLQVTNSLGDTARITLPVIVTSGNASRPVVNLKTDLVHLNAGDRFSAQSYLQSVVSTNEEATTEDVTITGSVDTNTPGTYFVYYRCSDSFGTGIAVLTVVVE